MGGPRRYGMENGGKMTKQRTTPTAKRNHGFTLMEMLIVVAIIAVLVAVAIPTFSSQLHKARVATDWANVRSYTPSSNMSSWRRGRLTTNISMIFIFPHPPPAVLLLS